MESKELKKILNKTRRTDNIELSVDQVKEIIKDLEMLEELKYPYDEYENEKYLCRREAYYNENLGELCFGYTIYEWRGEYCKNREKWICKTFLKKEDAIRFRDSIFKDLEETMATNTKWVVYKHKGVKKNE